jgi:DNA repair exonuclease SbcCD ATPase subunit
MSAIVFSDLQIFEKENYRESGINPLDLADDFLTNKLFPYAHERGIKIIFHVGDFVEYARPKFTTETRLIYILNRLHEAYPDIKLITNTGNHDVKKSDFFVYGEPYPKSILNALAEACPNFFVVDHNKDMSPIQIDSQTEIYMLPFFRSERQFLTALEDIANRDTEYNRKYLFMHQDVREKIYNSQISVHNPLFKKFDLIFNGHIHHRDQVAKNFYICGNVLELKAGDHEKRNKCFYEITDTGKVKTVEITGYPKFVEYYYGDDIKDMDKGQFIQRRKRPVKASQRNVLDDSHNSGRAEFAVNLDYANDLSEEAKVLLGELISKLEENSIISDVKEIAFHSIQIEGVRSIVKPISLSLDDAPLTYYIGQMGSGKTTGLLFALYWCLTGKPLTATQELLVSFDWLQDTYPGFKGTRVIVELSLNGKRFYASRHINYRGTTFKETGGSNFILFDEDKNPLDLGKLVPVDLNRKYLLTDKGDLLTGKRLQNRQFEVFSGISPDLLVNAVLFDSSKSTLLQSSQSDKQKVFSSLLMVDWIADLKMLVKEEKSKLLLAIEEKKHDIEVIMTSLNSSKDHILQLEELQQEELLRQSSELSTMKEEKGVLESSLGTAREELALLQQQANSLEAYRLPDTSQLEANIKLINQQIKIYEGECSAIQKQIDDHEARDEWRADLERVMIKGKGLTDQKKEIEDLVIDYTEKKQISDSDLDMYFKTKKELEDQLQDCKVETNNNIRTISLAQSELEKAQRDLLLMKDNKCPVCHQEMHDESMLSEQENNISSLEAKLQEAASLKVSFSNKVNLFEKDIEYINHKIEQENSTNIAVAEKIQYNKDRLHDIKTDLKLLAQAATNLKDKINVVELSESKISEFKTELKSKGLKIITLKVDVLREESQLKAIQAESQDIAEKVRQYDNILKQAQELHKVILRDEAKLDSLTERINSFEIKSTFTDTLIDVSEKMKRQIKVLHDAEKSVEPLEKQVELLDELSTKVLRANKLERKVIEAKLHKVNEYAEVYAAILNMGLKISLDDRNAYLVEVSMSGKPMPIDVLSNGQKLIANLIWLFALNDLCNERVSFNILQLDEPFKNLSELDSEPIVTLFQEKSKSKRLHVITHAENLDVSNATVKKFHKPELSYTRLT